MGHHTPLTNSRCPAIVRYGSIDWVNPPIAGSFEPEALVEAVQAEQRQVDLSKVVLHTEGWENVVLESADGWILRFPRDEGLAFEREMAILARLSGRLPAPIPAVAWTGTHTRFAAYRKLEGWAFDGQAWLAAPSWRRDEFAASLARFLVAMHTAFDDEDVTELGIPRQSLDGLVERVTIELDRIPDEYRTNAEYWVGRFAETWGAEAVPGPTVVLHNDFHLWNMVFTEPMGELAGVWDFSCVERGLPSCDLRYFVLEPMDLLHRLAAEYQRISGWEIDLEAATAAALMEDVCDFLETGRLECLRRRSWPT